MDDFVSITGFEKVYYVIELRDGSLGIIWIYYDDDERELYERYTVLAGPYDGLDEANDCVREMAGVDLL